MAFYLLNIITAIFLIDSFSIQRYCLFMASKKEIQYRRMRMTNRLKFLRKKYERVRAYYQHPKLCPFCSAPLSYERKHKTFCSRSCAMSAIKTGRPKTWIFTCCNFCHKDLWGSHRLQVKYCSTQCYQADRWRTIAATIEKTGHANDARTAKKYLIQIRGHKCQDCGRKTFQGEQISLTIHHKNAIPNDHRLKNLQLLCYTCHERTDSFCGKKHRAKFARLHKH